MIAILKKTGIIFGVLLLIAVTGGIPIYHHYCYHGNVSSTSIFLDTDCHEEKAKGITDCCFPEGNNSKKSADHQNCKCCNTTSSILKVQDPIPTRRPGTISLYLTTLQVKSENDLFQIDDHHSPVKHFSSITPFPVSGKKILLEIHQLKLAPELG